MNLDELLRIQLEKDLMNDLFKEYKINNKLSDIYSINEFTILVESINAPAIVKFNQPPLVMDAEMTLFENCFSVLILIIVPFILFTTLTLFTL